jgi:ATP-binding cassette subfamily G (WHITE) protein 2
MELVTSPDVIVLDEPTSGLDAATAASMVFTLRSLASAGAEAPGRVVIFSIHQPSPRAFRALDRVMLLGTGGRLLWAGAPGAAEAHFTAAGLPCPVENAEDARGGYSVDISEWMLEVASCPDMRATLLAADGSCGGGGGGSGSSEVNVVVVALSVRDNSGNPANADDADDDDAATSAAVARRERRRAERRQWRSSLTETRVLLRRSAITLFRDPTLLVAHFAIAAITGLLLGCLYLDSPLTLHGFQNRAGGIFFTLVFFGLASISAADRIAAESAIRAREIRSGYYGAASYVFATVVTDVAALRVLPAAIYAVVLYFMMGLRQSAAAFFTFLGLLELFVACTSLLCAFISLSATSPAVANLVATFSLLLSAMFGGFLVSIASIPRALRWLQWLSVYKYAWGGMLANEMNGQTFLFDTEFEGADVVGGLNKLNPVVTLSLKPPGLNS